MKAFECINIDTNDVVDLIQDMTPEQAEKANSNFRVSGTPYRWIEQRPQPSEDCRCGAETLHECVCNF